MEMSHLVKIQLRNVQKQKKRLNIHKQSLTIPVKQTIPESEELTERSSSKQSGSMLIKSERKTTSPMKLHKILSLSREEPIKNLGDIVTIISRIEMENDKIISKTLSLKNMRIQKVQLTKYLNRFYTECLAETICKALKVPAVLTYSQYQQWIEKIEKLDCKQIIKLCFIMYDINNEGEITTNNLLYLLNSSSLSCIEQDILHIIKQTRGQLLLQREQEKNCNISQLEKPQKINIVSLPPSILRCKLDQSVMLQQRRQSIIDSPTRMRGRTSIFKISNKQSIDLSLDAEPQTIKQNYKNQLITHFVEENDCEIVPIIRKRRTKLQKSQINRMSIDLNTFFNIWYPNKPSIFSDIFKRLTQKL